ncbi:MAG TPA: rhodanese-like domain-containing protein [Chlamydiales bacterium]|nr:rhodanese-like domain-containing protein [Chlamydiales bacterium]
MAIIDTSTLKILIESKTPFVLLDARSVKWDDGQRIPGAQSLPNDAPVEQLTRLNKNSLIVVYCTHSECGASGRLIHRLNELGYPFVLKYAEGIQEWIQQGHPILKEQDEHC